MGRTSGRRRFACDISDGIFRMLPARRQTAPGLIAHDPGYAAAFILRALRSGEARIDIPHGAEQPELAGIPAR